jgi:2-hydroxycyclohexanecarboxyl-CoA dehydrogenase
VDTGLRNRVVVVTGSTANIGRGIALAFAGEGARVVVVGRDSDAGARVVARATELGATDVFWRATDVTVEADVDGLFADVLGRYGQIDVLVNNVGGNIAVTPFARSTPDQWRFDLEINLMSTFLCTHAALQPMLARGAGRIINIGSMSGFIGDRMMAVYSASKGGIHAFTRVLALEVGKQGINVNAIAPYGTLPEDADEETSSGSRFHPTTGLFPRELAARPDDIATLRRDTVLQRQNAHTAEIGAAAVYLASDQAAFVTGQVIQIDGGVMLA